MIRRPLMPDSFVPATVTSPAATSSTSLVTGSLTVKLSTCLSAHELSPATASTMTTERRAARRTAQASHLRDGHRGLLVVGLTGHGVELVDGQPVHTELVPVEGHEHLARPHDAGDPHGQALHRAPSRRQHDPVA